MEQTTINSYLREREIKEDCQPKQNVTYLIPYSEPTKVQMIALTTMLSLLSVIGSVGNTLVILVFKSKQEKLVSTFYILVLSVVDLTTCLFIIPFTIYMENVRFRLSSDVACKFYQFLITSNIPFSALIMVAIAFDRYFAICHPLSQVGRHASPVSKVSVAVLACFATSIGIIVSLMYGVRIRVIPQIHDLLQQGSDVQPQLFEDLFHSDVYETNISKKQDFGEGASHFEGRLNSMMTLPTNSYANNSCGMNLRYVQVSSNLNNSQLVDFGQCTVNFILLTQDFIMNFQKAYISLYVVCFFTVAILYVMLFLSVCKRRQLRGQKKKNMQNIVGNMSKATPEKNEVTKSPIAEERLGETNNDQICLTTIHVEKKNLAEDGKNVQLAPGEKSRITLAGFVEKKQKKRRKSIIKDGQLMANLKTALMLFVVTVVFIVTYLPAFLCSLNYLAYNALVHYMYFANNVANPFIYSFMNQKFRNGLRVIFCGRKR